MIVENHEIAYRNVASKLYQFAPEEIEMAFKDFDDILTSQDYHPTGDLFFSILSDPTAEVMTAEIFLPIKEDHFANQSEEDVSFRSYFFVKPLLMKRIKEDFDAQSQIKYWELMEHLERGRMNQRTPMFVEYKSSFAGDVYVEMSLGFDRK